MSIPALPEGTVHFPVESEYHGHPDGLRYGEGSETCHLAVPPGMQLPTVKLVHGTLVRCWEQLTSFPEGTFVLRGQNWVPVAEFLAAK
ncbi:MAG: hypothetical protein K2W95_28670 [Candidatus Obscuribacterales bacterium]|nr:hypothetical protein [Candidatus Obscuribacterales bacterium]